MQGSKLISTNIVAMKVLTLAAFAIGASVTTVHMAHAQTSATSTDRQVARQISSVNKGLKKIRQALQDLKTTVTATPIVEPGQTTLGANAKTGGYVAFDIYPTRSGHAIVQHSKGAVAASFVILEGGKSVQQFDLKFPFAGRTADQKNADLFMLTNCVNLYNSVLANPEGGTFYVLTSDDEKTGVACSNDLNVTRR